MKAFRTLLLTAFVLLATYTTLVIANRGWGLFGVFFGGALFLTAYVFVASLVAKGDVKELLLGRAGTSIAGSPSTPSAS